MRVRVRAQTTHHLRRNPTTSPGDVLAHSFDLQHGVEVTAGRRASVVFWFTSCAASCAGRTQPWYASGVW